MADLRVRNVDDQALETIRARAQRQGRSLSEEVRAILRAEANRPRREFARAARELLEELRSQYGSFSDSAALIRADREERG